LWRNNKEIHPLSISPFAKGERQEEKIKKFTPPLNPLLKEEGR